MKKGALAKVKESVLLESSSKTYQHNGVFLASSARNEKAVADIATAEEIENATKYMVAQKPLFYIDVRQLIAGAQLLGLDYVGVWYERREYKQGARVPVVFRDIENESVLYVMTLNDDIIEG